ENLLALVVFLVVAGSVSAVGDLAARRTREGAHASGGAQARGTWGGHRGAVSAVVARAARRTREAAHASADAQTLATVAGAVLRGARPLEALLERLRETFSLDSVTLLERRSDAPRSPDHQRDPAS